MYNLSSGIKLVLNFDLFWDIFGHFLILFRSKNIFLKRIQLDLLSCDNITLPFLNLIPI